jgi:hypothetical protein
LSQVDAAGALEIGRGHSSCCMHCTVCTLVCLHMCRSCQWQDTTRHWVWGCTTLAAHRAWLFAWFGWGCSGLIRPCWSWHSNCSSVILSAPHHRCFTASPGPCTCTAVVNAHCMGLLPLSVPAFQAAHPFLFELSCGCFWRGKGERMLMFCGTFHSPERWMSTWHTMCFWLGSAHTRKMLLVSGGCGGLSGAHRAGCQHGFRGW